jgi:hypothetical protein
LARHGAQGAAAQSLCRHRPDLSGRETAVWIGERIDRDYRIRCEWSDVSGPARRWLASIAPTFAASAERLGFAPSTPIDQPWLAAA